jgi:cell division inhibitor SulA
VGDTIVSLPIPTGAPPGRQNARMVAALDCFSRTGMRYAWCVGWLLLELKNYDHRSSAEVVVFFLFQTRFFQLIVLPELKELGFSSRTWLVVSGALHCFRKWKYRSCLVDIFGRFTSHF